MKTISVGTAFALVGLAVAGGAGSVMLLSKRPVERPKSFLSQTSNAQPVNSSEVKENIAGLRSLNESFAGLAEYVLPAVVQIKTITERTTDSEGRRVPISGSEGSGFIFRKDGYIITNEHVVKGAKEVTVILNDGREITGKVTTAPDWDIAVVKIKGDDYPTLSLTNSKQVKPGQMVMAIGSPYGLENSVTFGNVSAIGRQNQIGDQFFGGTVRFYPDLIQTDAAINMGNSGGPLVNIDGQVIGMNSSIFSRGGGSNGIGFAIPSNQVEFIVDLLIRKGKVDRAMMGVEPRDLKPFELKEKGLSGGALIETVSPDGPAAKAGLKSGDIITKIGGTSISGQLDLRNAMLVHEAGKQVIIEFLRDGKSQQVNVKLQEFKMPQRTSPKIEEDIQDFGDLFRDGKTFDLEDLRNRSRSRTEDRFKSESDVAPLREGKPRLGVSIENLNDENRKENNVPKEVKGVLISSVEPGSVAEKAGLKAGDIVEQFSTTSVNTVDELSGQIKKVKSGDKVRIRIRRFDSNSVVMIERDVQF